LASRDSLFKIVSQTDSFSGTVLLVGDLEGFLELRIELFKHIIKVGCAEKDSGGLAALCDKKARLPPGDPLEQ